MAESDRSDARDLERWNAMARELTRLQGENEQLREGWRTALGDAIDRAESKHPSGPDGMRSLAEEVGEVASAMRRETRERVRAELLDVAVVAIRWWQQLGRLGP